MVSTTFLNCVFGLIIGSTLANVPFQTCRKAAAASFSPIEVPAPSWSGIPPYASPQGISPNGLRVVGGVVSPGVIFDCPSFLGCTSGFSWEKETGTTIGNVAGFPTTTSQSIFGERELYAASMVAASNEVVLAHADIRGGYIGPLLLTAEGPVQLSEERLSVGLRATAISNSGAVVLGSQGYFNGTRSFRWTAETGIQEFGIDEKSSVFPNALSGNGQVIVGLIYDSPTPFLVEETVISNGFRWNESEGFSMIPNESEERRFVPTATSFDGSLIVGNGVDVNRRSYVLDQSASELLEPRAIAWTEEMGTQLLELPTQFKSSSVVDVSDDGRLIVGAAILENPLELGDPPSTEGVPVLVDGKRAAEIVASKSRAMLWDENRQALDLQQWLKDHHHLSDALEGWTLTSASAISANGRIIAGLGVNPDGDLQGWVVTIPEPCTLALSAFPLLLLSLWQRQVCLLTGRKCGSGDPRLDPRPHPH